LGLMSHPYPFQRIVTHNTERDRGNLPVFGRFPPMNQR
jgi:hypothetical protein